MTVAQGVRGFRFSTSTRWQNAQSMVVALLLALGMWQILTMISGGWVPSLPRIARAFWDDATTAKIYSEMWITFRRILITFSIATVIGIMVGMAMGLSRKVNAFLRPIIVMALAVPDIVYIIVAILVLGTEESSGLTALTIDLTPFVVIIALSGVQSRDHGLDEMSSVYRLGRSRYLFDVVGRQVTPALMAATRTSFNFAWKLIVLVEALTQPRGIGSQIYYSFRLLRPDHMIAQSLLFIIVLRITETIMFKPLERRLFAWMR